MRFPNTDNQERSGPHRRVEAALDEMGLAYLSEERFPPYKVDIYLPEWHCAIEVDGLHHSRGRDLIRDRFLFSYYGLSILRIKVKHWLGKKKIKEKIVDFIVGEADSTEGRKELWLTRH